MNRSTPAITKSFSRPRKRNEEARLTLPIILVENPFLHSFRVEIQLLAALGRSRTRSSAACTRRGGGGRFTPVVKRSGIGGPSRSRGDFRLEIRLSDRSDILTSRFRSQRQFVTLKRNRPTSSTSTIAASLLSSSRSPAPPSPSPSPSPSPCADCVSSI